MRTESSPQRGDVHLKRAIANDRARPDAIHQVTFRYEMTGGADQNFDDLESFSANRDGHSARAQFAPGKIDFTLACLIHSRAHGFGHCNHPSVTGFIAY